jgi:hypothetical protein
MWAGTFRSSMYSVMGDFPLVHGEITAELPDAGTGTGTGATEAWKEGVAVFGYRGAYRNGERSEFRFGYDGADGQEIGIGIGGQVGKCVAFKGRSNVTRQTIRFTVELKTTGVLKGHYESSSPEDSGSFVMRSLNPEGQ